MCARAKEKGSRLLLSMKLCVCARARSQRARVTREKCVKESNGGGGGGAFCVSFIILHMAFAICNVSANKHDGNVFTRKMSSTEGAFLCL